MKALVELETYTIIAMSFQTDEEGNTIWPPSVAQSNTVECDVPAGSNHNHLISQDDGQGGAEIVIDTAAKEPDHWDRIRSCRTQKLLECDEARNYMTWAESDTPWTQQQKDDWRNYRQALLDTPQNIQADIDAVTIDSVLDIDLETYTWPTEPTLP